VTQLKEKLVRLLALPETTKSEDICKEVR
jgi:hypothetical protein